MTQLTFQVIQDLANSIGNQLTAGFIIDLLTLVVLAIIARSLYRKGDKDVSEVWCPFDGIPLIEGVCPQCHRTKRQLVKAMKGGKDESRPPKKP